MEGADADGPDLGGSGGGGSGRRAHGRSAFKACGSALVSSSVRGKRVNVIKARLYFSLHHAVVKYRFSHHFYGGGVPANQKAQGLRKASGRQRPQSPPRSPRPSSTGTHVGHRMGCRRTCGGQHRPPCAPPGPRGPPAPSGALPAQLHGSWVSCCYSMDLKKNQVPSFPNHFSA